MKTTNLGKSEIQQTYFDCENLRDLMLAIESRMQESGEVVCQYVLNGMVLQEADEARMSGIGIEEIKNLEVRTEKPTALLFEILKNWELEIPRIIEQTDGLAKSMRADGPEGHYTAFVNLIDSCQFLIESLVSMDSVIETQFFLSRQDWSISEKQMSQAIHQALQSFEKRDFSMLGDILEYDLANSLQSWLDILVALNHNLRQEHIRDSEALALKIFKKNEESVPEAT